MARLDFTEALSIDPDQLGSYLTAQGFVKQAPGRWSRGGMLGAWLGFTPKSWPATVTAEGGQLSLAVRAGGQILTRAEEAFWALEWDNLRAAACGQLTDTTALARRRDVSFVENTLVTALPFPLSAAAGITAGILVGFWAGLLTFLGSIAVLYVVGVSWLRIRR